MFDFLMSAASAADETGVAAEGGAGMVEIMLLVVFVLIFYFMLWRPQSKRAKEHRNLMSSLEKGDEILTAGGLYGKINKTQDDMLHVLIANNLEIRLQKSAVVAVLPKGTLKFDE